MLREDGTERQVMGPAYNSKTLKPATAFIGPNDDRTNFFDALDKAPQYKSCGCWVVTIEQDHGNEYGSGAKLGGK